jgi:hypothetical protein
MLDLFGTSWDSLNVDVLRDWLAEAGEEGVTWEAKADDDRGRLRVDSVRKAGCGLANQIGGYIILGARWDEAGSRWTLPGVTIPDPEPEAWIGKAIRGLQPKPRHRTRAWEAEGGRTIAVVWIDPVDIPPCMTPSGRVYERVSGMTIPVEDPALLSRLLERGDAARGRAKAFADRAASRATRLTDWEDERAVAVALALAPIGRETDDIGGRLFTRSFRDALVKAAWRFWDNSPPSEIDSRQEQDAMSVAGHFRDRYILQRGGAAGRGPRASWVLQAIWDGTVVASASFSPEATVANPTVETAVQRGWREVVPLVERLGGYGPAHLSLLYVVTQPRTDIDVPRDAQPLPMGDRLLSRLPGETWIRRQLSVSPPAGDDIGSIQRELQRAAGIESDEPEPEDVAPAP